MKQQVVNNLTPVQKRELAEAAKILWSLINREAEVWKERGELLSEARQRFGDNNDTAFGEWCGENGYFGLQRANLFRQRKAYELQRDAPVALVRHLPNDYLALAAIAGKLPKIEKMIAEGKTANLFNQHGKITRTTLAAAFPGPPRLPAKGGVAKQCWTPADFKMVRQYCHPDKHADKKEGWTKVWHLLELVYKG